MKNNPKRIYDERCQYRPEAGALIKRLERVARREVRYAKNAGFDLTDMRLCLSDAVAWEVTRLEMGAITPVKTLKKRKAIR